MPGQTSLRWPVCAAVSLAFFAANAGQGVAQDAGVHVDPESPAGKEYALPLDAARQGAGGGHAGSSLESTSSAPLFGAGISSERSGRRDGASAGGPSAGNGSGSKSGESEASATAGTASKSVAAAATDAGSGIPAGFLTALIALGVLGVGMAVGLSLRSLRAGNKSY